jgi:hypothetical protein
MKPMLDLFPEAEKPIEIVPARKLAAKVAALYVAPSDHFETRPVDALRLGFDGISGDFHAGATRRSGGREPWYPRGTEMRNERQLSIVAMDELAIVAERLAKGRAMGELPEGLSVEGFAKYLAGVMNGMSIQARDGASVEELRTLAQIALAALPA